MPNQYGIVEKVARVCQHCGETFWRYPSQLVGVGQGRFCSRSCMASSRTGDKNSCWNGGQDTRSCAGCGKAFRAVPANPQRFCSRECGNRCGIKRGKPRTSIERTCTHCGKTFFLKASAVARGHGKFCSQRCKTSHSGADYTCKQCGKRFHAPINNLRGGRKFCSQQCRANYWGPRWRGPNSPCWKGASAYGRIAEMCRTDYKEWRKAVYARDDYTCQRCKRRGVYLHAHHKQPWAQFPELRYAVDNGETLCAECHKITHMTSNLSRPTRL
jgi:endogenous inhibitor of DNA gyrase (YacG/DUF329 family)